MLKSIFILVSFLFIIFAPVRHQFIELNYIHHVRARPWSTYKWNSKNATGKKSIPNKRKTETNTIQSNPIESNWNQFWTTVASAEPYSYNFPTNASCVNWNQYYTNCSQLGGNPFQSTISFDNIGMVSLALYPMRLNSLILKRNANDNDEELNENCVKSFEPSLSLTHSYFFPLFLCVSN